MGSNCLTRVTYTGHGIASRVCRRWHELLQSKEFYHHRKKSGHTHKVACLVQALPGANKSSTERKRGKPPSYGITVFDPVGVGTWERLDQVPKYPDGLPQFCQLASCEGKLVVMGGWDPARTCRRSARSLRPALMRAKYAWRAGMTTDEYKNASRSAWVYDLRRDKWDELTQLSQERDECEGTMIGDEFWVVSGYDTESQGVFEGSADLYAFGLGGWRRVDGVWEPGQCPRSCVVLGWMFGNGRRRR
ncbi:hypothetical protein FH972_019863 [Carpinus fangiana]|uniref:F-box domain-containing protein n=1 Tax=Carpinus fangiana TaxID=176857 RepID=A0A5N6RRG1_9ROSI|nr:hypothetical protein FH972_019863 [Carpinus fangiana]